MQVKSVLGLCQPLEYIQIRTLSNWNFCEELVGDYLPKNEILGDHYEEVGESS